MLNMTVILFNNLTGVVFLNILIVGATSFFVFSQFLLDPWHGVRVVVLLLLVLPLALPFLVSIPRLSSAYWRRRTSGSVHSFTMRR